MQTYSLLLNGKEAGYYTSKAPNVSARKIFRAVSRKLKSGHNEFVFDIINVKTRKIYKYRGIRKECNENKTFIKNGIERLFIVKYKYRVRRLYEEDG